MADDRDKASKKLTFKVWIDKLISDSENVSEQSKKIKEILKTFFNDDTEDSNWDVIVPKGDGFCGLYAAELDVNEGGKYNFDTEGILIENIENEKDYIIDKLVEGIINYYEARQQHIMKNIDLPDHLIGKDFEIQLLKAEITISINDKSIENKEKLRSDLLQLKDEDNMDINVFTFAAYGYKRSYLIIEYFGGEVYDTIKKKRNEIDEMGISLMFRSVPCYSNVDIIDDKTIYPNLNNKTILFNNDHYALFQNDDDKKKNYTSNLIEKIIDKDPNHFYYKEAGHNFVSSKLERNTIDINTAINEAKAAIIEDEVKKEVKPEKTPVQQFLKKYIVNYFKKRKERNKIKDKG